jgi:toxin-antitoxin system PIN domain toxin
MIAIDTNLLVYAHRRDAADYARARDLMKSLTQGRVRFAIPYHCLVEFYGIVTHPKVYQPPSTVQQASEQLDAWLASPVVQILTEGGIESWTALKGLLAPSKTIGPRVHDARIAALCLEHGISELLSVDRDFGRFPALKVRNPLIT